MQILNMVLYMYLENLEQFSIQNMVFWTSKPCWNQSHSYFLLVKLMNYIYWTGGVWCLRIFPWMLTNPVSIFFNSTLGEHKSKNLLVFQVFWNIPRIIKPLLPFGPAVVIDDSWSGDVAGLLSYQDGSFGSFLGILILFFLWPFRHVIRDIQLKIGRFFQ